MSLCAYPFARFLTNIIASASAIRVQDGQEWRETTLRASFATREFRSQSIQIRYNIVLMLQEGFLEGNSSSIVYAIPVLTIVDLACMTKDLNIKRRLIMKRIVFLTAAAATVCLSTAALAAEIEFVDGAVRLEVAENITQAPEQQRTTGTTADDEGGPAALPHHQPTSRWYRHRKNTTSKLIAAPVQQETTGATAGDVGTPPALPRHFPTSRWAKHYKNTSSPPPK